MKTTIKVTADRTIITTGDIKSVFSGEYEPASDAIVLLHGVIAQQRETLDRLPQCWRLRAGKLVQDCPVVPGMMAFVVANYGDGERIHKRTVYDLSAIAASDGDRYHWSHKQSANSPEAAEALALQRSDDV